MGGAGWMEKIHQDCLRMRDHTDGGKSAFT
jgi:hypothetical protein